MEPAKYHLKIVQADHISIWIPLKVAGVAVDLSGSELFASKIKDAADLGGEGWSFTCVTNAVDNRVELTMPKAVSILPPLDCFWDVSWENYYGTDKPLTIISGKCTVIRQVTDG